MTTDLKFFLDILSIDSTSGEEAELVLFLERTLAHSGCIITQLPAGSQPCQSTNLLLSWGDPQIVYCTHLDTVPPYIAPTVTEKPDGTVVVNGRGACDAKGQIFAMLSACLRLASEGKQGFGLLLVHGEETASLGAKEVGDSLKGKCVIVGEPTNNKMVEACKGTKLFEVTLRGIKCHSGYPHLGMSAVDEFVDFVNDLRELPYPEDEVLGSTTFNIGRLKSDNPQNVLSDLLTFRIYFRTTFASDEYVCRTMESFNCETIEVKALGGDSPAHYYTLPGFETSTAAFGSDAPYLTGFEHTILCGPGSISLAHTAMECITMPEIEQAIDLYVAIFDTLNKQ